jgi:hypothetical protein
MIRFFVMAGLVPAIHVFFATTLVKAWMPGTSAGMTSFAITAGSIGYIWRPANSYIAIRSENGRMNRRRGRADKSIRHS